MLGLTLDSNRADDSSGTLLVRIASNSGGCGVAATATGLSVLSSCQSTDSAELFTMTPTSAMGPAPAGTSQSTWQW